MIDSTNLCYLGGMGQPPRALSLFSGAGGLDLGVEAAGYDVVYAVENDATAVRTLNENRERWFPALAPVTPLDITALDPAAVMHNLGIAPGDLNLLVGGPPCVAFSKSGFHLEYKREGRDPKADLLGDYLKFLDALRPQAYLIENVFGLAYRNKSAGFFDALRKGIERLGYSFTFRCAERRRLWRTPEPTAALHDRSAETEGSWRCHRETHWGTA